MRKSTLTERPEAMMINIPQAYFQEKSEEAFRRYYESMGHGVNTDGSFYHWISNVPVHDVTHVFVCFHGKIQYKAIVVEKIKNMAPFEGWEVRNYLVTTGPVIKAPEHLEQKGFRGFRYCRMFF